MQYRFDKAINETINQRHPRTAELEKPQAKQHIVLAPVVHGIVLVGGDQSDAISKRRWVNWDEAARFGQSEVEAGRAIGFRVIHITLETSTVQKQQSN